jgi:hypothetical protein
MFENHRIEGTQRLMGKIRSISRLIAGKWTPGPELEVYPDDTFLIAYSKSGNTWTRFLVANLLYPDKQVTFLNIPELIPHFDVMPKRFFREMARPRIINCHEAFRPHYKRVIYVVRDPRDVVVSLYHFQRKRRIIEDDYPLDRFVTRFVAGEALKPARLGTWGDNVASWRLMRQRDPGFMLLRYEDMLADTESVLDRIAPFLGIKATPERIAHAVECSSAHNMRSLEQVQGDQWHQSKDTRKDIPFVRSARSGGWKSALPQRAVSEIESAWGPLMEELGYKPCTTTALGLAAGGEVAR